MTKRIKNITSRSGFIRYRKGEMTAAEKNAFERDLQKDPFSEEAAEGFELISAGEMQKDMSLLEKKIAQRTRKKNHIFYRIAASIAVLMIISSVFVIVQRNSKITPASLSGQQVPLSIISSEPIKPGAPSTDKEQSQLERQRTGTEDQKKIAEKAEQPVQDVNDITRDEAVPSEAPEMKIQEEQTRAEKRMALVDALPGAQSGAASGKSLRKSEIVQKISGRVLSMEDSMPLPGTTIQVKGTTEAAISDSNGNFSLDLPGNKDVTLVASNIGMKPVELSAAPDKPVEITMQPDVATLDEVVVIGYGVSGERPPEPINGKTAFNKYIEENIHRPDSATTAQRAVVVARFPVLTDGTTGNINIIRTPGEEFSKEAVRLIKSGPAWKPATRRGVPVEDSVTVRIVFR